MVRIRHFCFNGIWDQGCRKALLKGRFSSIDWEATPGISIMLLTGFKNDDHSPWDLHTKAPGFVAQLLAPRPLVTTTLVLATFSERTESSPRLRRLVRPCCPLAFPPNFQERKREGSEYGQLIESYIKDRQAEKQKTQGLTTKTATQSFDIFGFASFFKTSPFQSWRNGFCLCQVLRITTGSHVDSC